MVHIQHDLQGDTVTTDRRELAAYSTAMLRRHRLAEEDNDAFPGTQQERFKEMARRLEAIP